MLPITQLSTHFFNCKYWCWNNYFIRINKINLNNVLKAALLIVIVLLINQKFNWKLWKSYLQRCCYQHSHSEHLPCRHIQLCNRTLRKSIRWNATLWRKTPWKNHRKSRGLFNGKVRQKLSGFSFIKTIQLEIIGALTHDGGQQINFL